MMKRAYVNSVYVAFVTGKAHNDGCPKRNENDSNDFDQFELFSQKFPGKY